MSTLRSETEALLIAQVRAQRTGRRAAAILLFLICGVGGIALSSSFDSSERKVARGIAMGGLGALLSIGLFATTLRDPRRHRSIELLRTEPERVVWLYLEQPPRPPWTEAGWARAIPGLIKESTLSLGLQDGTRQTFGVRAGSERAVFEAVAAAVPAATTGYSAQLEARFKQAPSSLRRAAT